MVENMLDYLRIALFTALLVLGMFLYQAWENEHAKPLPTSAVQTDRLPVSASVAAADHQAATTTAAVASPVAAQSAAPATGQLVNVTTDVLQAQIDTRGGDVVQVTLLKYPESLHSKTPFLLLNNDPKTQYIAESGLLSQMGPDTTASQALYQVAQPAYALAPGQQQVTVDLTWQNAQGLKITKHLTFTRGSYQVTVTYDIQNTSAQPWQGSLYTQLLRTNVQPPNHSGFMNLATYFGAAISSPQKPYDKITFKKMQEQNLDQTVQGGWAAMIQHYFISAWVPPAGSTSTYYSRVNNGLFTIGMIGQPLSVAPGARVTTTAKLYTGPAIADTLEQTAPGLKLTIDYGWFWFISSIIFWMMQTIYNVVGNWGWSIVLVTVVIKLLFYPLSNKSYRSMSVLKKLQPKIEALKQRYGDDKQGFTKAMMELYRTEKVNPMSGCLPILIQIPVFIALYWVLVESVQLRQAPFIFWIHDLSIADPYYVLPVLMGISMFVQQRLNPPPPDPVQAKVMMMMPILFTAMFAGFPAGLILYWVVNNTLSFMQQWYVMHKLNVETNGKR